MMSSEKKEEVTPTSDGMSTYFESLFLTIPYPIFFKDKNFKYTWGNQALVDFFSRPIEKIIGSDDFELFPKEHANKIRRIDKVIMTKSEGSYSNELLLLDSKWRERWFLSIKSPVRDKSGDVAGLAGFALDITESKVANAELKLLEPAINQTTDSIVITDVDGVIKYVNPAFETLTGFSVDEVIGKCPSILKSGRQSDDFYKALWENITTGDTWNGHFINKRKDGTEYEEEATISPVYGRDGEISHFIGVKKDVTKLVELENKIRQSDKMEAIGRLAGGMAHDFNNILTAILGYSEILLGSLPADDSARRKVKEIKKAGQRASEITKQMLAFSKKQVMRLTPLDINSVIKDMLPMLKEIAGKKIGFSLKLKRGLSMINSDKTHIERIVMNLVVNSVDASGTDGGKIVISSEHRILTKPFSDGNFNISPGNYIVISVADKGCGIADDIIEHIFEPFFTSKKGEKGTGLGLSTIYGIVKQHKGCIMIDSVPGKGARFEILLPRVADKKPIDLTATDHGDEVDLDSENPLTLLVVDDEPSLLEMMYETLEDNGYNVLKATSGTKALELFLMAGQDVDLLVSDIILHDMTGIELTEAIRKTAPDIPVVFISGYTGNEHEILSLDSCLNDFLPKPFVMEELEAKISSMLQKR